MSIHVTLQDILHVMFNSPKQVVHCHDSHWAEVRTIESLIVSFWLQKLWGP